MRLIDADALIGTLHNYGFYDGNDRTLVYEVIQLQPTIETGHIHCRDCRWFEPDRHQCGRQVCAVFYEDDYCSFAERCTDETD